jgi:hypothetical protein
MFSMIVLLMLTQRSCMLFWALAGGQANIDEDDDDDIHIENSNGADDYSIDDEE